MKPHYDSIDAIENQQEISTTTTTKRSASDSRNHNLLLFFSIVLSYLLVVVVLALNNQHVSTRNNVEIAITDFEEASISKPNFIFILADDLGWNSLGFQGYENRIQHSTPFLQKLANDGIYMTTYYGQEVCTPSRAALLTGRYPLSMGMQFGEVDPAVGWGLNVSETLLPEVMKENGYATYMVGKWHLGHYTPEMLPTARGFDYFVGFLAGQSYFWSKRDPQYYHFHDLLYMNKDCYAPYNGTDMHKYATFFYRDKAIDIIEGHNYDDSPLFLYVSMQAVHDPFFDVKHFTSGIPIDYLSADIYEDIMQNVTGRKQRQYIMSLTLLDQAVSKIYDAVVDAGQKDNTYIIFA